MEEQVGRRLALGNFHGAEDPAFEAGEQTGQDQPEPDVLRRSTRGHAVRDGDLVERLHDAVHRSEVRLECLTVAVLVPLIPIVRERAPQMSRHVPGHGPLRPAQEPFHHLVLGHVPTELCQNDAVDGNRDALAVHQHAVAVEDDQLERIRHGRAV